ncbi:hypothetical protein [Streptomyces sp. NPDC001930]
MSDSYPCPCRGHRVLGAMPGSYETCPVRGANEVSLIEARRHHP